MNEEVYMKRAIELAKKGAGYVSPNPMVGAVIVKKGKIIGAGFHEKYGSLHAERNAIASCTEDPRGAVMYVTLEPCCHYGKTPPCTEAIINSGIERVVIGSIDPNILVAGKGIEILKNAGIETKSGVLKEECEQLNQFFFHYIKEKTPFVLMKYAMTMDGKIATASGFSKWITGSESRENVHSDRGRFSGIMVGVGTVIADDPMLTCRALEDGKNWGSPMKNPIRIICDSNLRTPLNSSIVKTAMDVRTIIATACEDESAASKYRELGCEILVIPKREGHIDLKILMKELGKIGIDSVFLEGGSTLNFSALKSEIVKKIQVYIAPKIFGGAAAKSPVGGDGVINVEDGFKVKNKKVISFGEDILIEGELEYRCLQG